MKKIAAFIGALILAATGGTFAYETIGSNNATTLVTALASTSTTAAWSNPISISNAEKVTCFIGENIHSGPSINTVGNIEYTFEVSTLPEPQQAAAVVSTTTEFTTDVNTVGTVFIFSTSTPLGTTNGASTTLSLDLAQNVFSFFRVVRSAAAADTSTGTVDCLISH